MSASDDQNEEGKRLHMISIPQSFAWTGLKKRRNEKNEGPTLLLAMEGLVLWNVLGFALNDTNNYAAFSVVNKEWNQVVKTLEPPFMFRIKALLGSTGNKELTTDDLSHLSRAFYSLESRDSSLYRKDKKIEGDTSVNIEKWPFVQPHFALLLLRFTYQGATQKKPVRKFGFSREIYESTSEFLEHIAQRTIQKVVHAIGKLEKGATPSTVLEELLEHWQAWSGIVHTVIGITEYLDRYYVPDQGLKTMMGQAQHKLVQAIMEEQGKLVEPMHMYLEHIYTNEINTATDGLDQQLLLQAFAASENLSSFETVQLDTVVGTSQIQESYTRIQIWMQDHILPQKQDSSAPNQDEDDTNKDNGRMITLVFPNGTKLDACKHFVESSPAFSHLYLGKDDFVRWETDSDIPLFKKVLEFYTIDARTPMREIARPLRSSVLAELVGQEFADLVESMEEPVLFGVIKLAHFLGTERLLDLTCASVANSIRGLPAEEIREVLNIT